MFCLRTVGCFARYRNVAEAASDMTAADLADWIGEFRLSPWGEARGDIQAGIIASTVANAAPFRARGAKSLKVADFIPQYESIGAPGKPEASKPRPWQEQKAAFMAFAQAHNARIGVHV